MNPQKIEQFREFLENEIDNYYSMCPMISVYTERLLKEYNKVFGEREE